MTRNASPNTPIMPINRPGNPSETRGDPAPRRQTSSALTPNVHIPTTANALTASLGRCHPAANVIAAIPHA